MPELPECERTRRLIERAAAGRRITRVSCANDSIVFEDGSTRTRRALSGRTIVSVHRRGKQIWCALDRRPWPVFHLGMTGGFRTPEAKPLELKSSARHEAPQWPPRFTKVRMYLDDGGELVFTNARRFGRVRLREDPETEPPISELGFDPILDLPSPRRFVSMLLARKAPVKAVLLDQGFAAGVGTWIADEVLYQAGIDPRRRSCQLDEAEARKVRTKLRAVVQRAVDVDADKKRFPRAWLFHDRWGKEQGAVTRRGEPIEFTVVGGRTTAWVPTAQG